MSSTIKVASLFFTFSFLLCACGGSDYHLPPLHARPPGFWEAGKGTFQVLHSFRVGKLDDAGNLTIETATELGTGLVVDVNGLVLTNHHAIVKTEPLPVNTFLVPASDEVEVCAVKDGERECMEAIVVDTDAGNDLALLFVKQFFDTPVIFTDDRNMELGDEVYLWGNIFGWAPISPAFGRLSNWLKEPYMPAEEAKPYTLPMMVLDVTFVQGSSGGGVFDLWGRCVGQAKAFSNPTGGRQVALATPSSTIMEFLKKNKVKYKVQK